ncbi:MAG: hypothetical protein AAFY83_04245, partial [Pseudomonadota bacterium]
SRALLAATPGRFRRWTWLVLCHSQTNLTAPHHRAPPAQNPGVAYLGFARGYQKKGIAKPDHGET